MVGISLIIVGVCFGMLCLANAVEKVIDIIYAVEERHEYKTRQPEKKPIGFDTETKTTNTDTNEKTENTEESQSEYVSPFDLTEAIINGDIDIDSVNKKKEV